MENESSGGIAVLMQESLIRLTLSGEADMDFVNAFSKTAKSLEEQNDRRPLVVDLAGVSYMDSAALAVFARLIKIYKRTDKKIILLSPNEMLEQTFDYTGLNKFVEICRSEEDLIKST